ncbi:hypothetical protein GYMLUDRAFT_161497 [Collybiopsis luxurians FD-317 M1]|uniref:Outer spore wall protein RRT8 n=1 Tax=Collybiopsis luxurians FD-317 M1 TaxID=944289 RepID=A0A0D0C719_9AGAR|nr:hypothetical protein GYMLUDRAFT_161497 [Collybiopsis luxurians FD-317 M1]
MNALKSAVDIAKDALLSGAWIYPFHGIIYFVSHPSLYRAVQPVLAKCLLISGGITGAMFFFTYLPQVAFLALFSGPLAFAAAAVLVLGESYGLVVMATKMFILEDAQDKIFDAVLLQQGHEALVSSDRRIETRRSGIKTVGKSLTKPLSLFSKDGIIRYIISLPLNSVPVVGTTIFLLYNGQKAGPRYHARYFQLKGTNVQDRQAIIAKMKGAYTAFGAVALALNLIPVGGLVFNFTSTVGAALWAGDLEKKHRGSSGHVAPVPVEIEATS